MAFAHGIYLINGSHTVLTYVREGSGPPIIRMHQCNRVLLTASIVSSDAYAYSEVRSCVVSGVLCPVILSRRCVASVASFLVAWARSRVCIRVASVCLSICRYYVDVFYSAMCGFDRGVRAAR